MRTCHAAASAARMVAMIRFTLFGIPVSIHPSLWLTLAVLGGVLGTTSMLHLFSVCLFVIAGFFCLLCHEMGHALVGRYFGGGTPCIYLAWLGGDCTNTEARMTRLQGVLMTAAGPLASLLLGGIVTLLLGLYVGNMQTGGYFALNFIFGVIPLEAWDCGSRLALLFFTYLLQVSFWWSLLNLIPVFPLDGGQIMHGLMSSPRRVHVISLGIACVLGVLFGLLGCWLMTAFMVWLAVLNYNFLRQAPY